jgi:undecaprenyl-diphosphatase
VLDAIVSLDTFVFIFLNHTIANPVFDIIFPVITNGLFWIVPGIATAIFFIKLEKKKAAVILCLSLVTVGISDPVCNRIIKPAVHRLRPCNPQVHIENGRFLLGRKTSASFPSSHAMNIFAQAMFFSLFYRRKRAWFFTFAAIISFTRIYVGVHYPLDVLAGAVFGICAGALVYGGYRVICLQIEHRRRKYNNSILRLRPNNK